MAKREGTGAHLVKELEKLKPHDHVCLIYESPGEWEAAIIPFILIGLERGEKCIYIVDTSTAKELRQHLKKAGVNISSVESSGQLIILHESQAYTKGGVFDPDLMIKLLIAETEKALSDGYPALRVTSEMTWALKGIAGSDRLLEYEAKLNRDFFPKYPCVAICQYDRRRFNPEIIKGIIMTHPKIVHGSRVSPNFYYIPTEEFLNHKRAELEAQHWLNNIARQDKEREELEESEVRYLRLFEAAKDGILIVNAEDGKIEDINPYLLDLLGYSRQEVRGKQLWELGLFKDKLHSQDSFRRLQEKGYVHYEDLPLETKDGRSIAVEFVSNVYQVNGNKVIQCNIRNITERKRAEAALERSEARYRDFYDNAPIAYLSIDNTGRIVQANKAVCTLLGYTPEELIGKHRLAIVAEECQDKSRDLARRFDRGETIQDEEMVYQRKDGQKVYGLLSFNQIRDGAGRVIASRSIIEDITKRKQAEESLRESEERYSNFIQSTSEMIQSVAPDGRFLFVNRAWHDILGYSEEDLKNLTIFDIIHEDSLEHCGPLFQEVLSGKSVKGIEARFKVKDGSTIDVDGTAAPRLLGDKIVATQGFFRDVTARKRAAEALRESEEKFKSLVNNVKLGILRSAIVDQGRALEVNPALEEIVGYSRDELLKMDFANLYPDPAERRALLEEVAATEEPVSREMHWKRKDGREIVVLYKAIAARDDAGEIMYLNAIVEDITERKHMEAELKESEEKYRSLVNNVKSGILRSITTGQGRALEINPAFEKITGYSRRELLEMGLAKLYANAEERRAFLEAVATTKQPVIRELLWKRKDGRGIVVLNRVAPVINNAGEIVYLDCIVEDITERKQVEEELRQSEAKYAALVEKGNDGIVIIQEGLIKFANRQMAMIIGFSLAETLGKPLTDFIVPNDVALVYDRYKKRMAGEPVPSKYEARLLSRSGEEIPVEISASVIEYEGKPADMAIIRDITERKRMEEQLIVTDRLASIGELAAGLAHEINNPLTGVIGFSQLLLGKELPDDARESVNIIHREAQRTAEIVKNLLTFARKHAPLKQTVNINEVIEKVLQLRAYEQRVNNIRVVTKLATNLPEIMADYFQLQQVFLNIIINAEYFMTEAHSGGTLTIGTSKDGQIVRASFADDGPGIAPQALGHIFDPFFTTKQVGKGTGLGLSICHGIVSEHGGKIYAENEQGKGATFIIDLPVSILDQP